jgi:hypothetical protein
MIKTLCSYFKDIVNNAKYDDRYAVNYVWINKDCPARPKAKPPSGGDAKQPSCSVPLNLLDKAYENAKRYPAADFTIWYDKAMMDPLSEFFMISHSYLNAPANVEFKDLRTLDAYEALGVFSVSQPKDIWARVDLARLLVLQHGLSQAGTQDYQLYSDFDVEDLCLNSTRMQCSLKDEGLFLGATIEHNMLENGYMCFDRNAGAAYLKDRLIPATLDTSNQNENGWRIYLSVFREWAEERGYKNSFQKLKLVGKRQLGNGYELPENKNYTKCGLN